MIFNKRRNAKCILVLAVLLITISLVACTQSKQKNERFVVRGDLHVHSNYSRDSDVSTEQVVAESGETGYDFVALTNHNTLNGLNKDFNTDKVIVLPGYELTLETGHINLFGVRSFEERVSVSRADEITEFLNYFHGLGGFAQINHPNDPKYNAKFGYDIPVDFIEVWNNAKFGDDDKKTLEDWHNMLCQGRKLVATAGTDAHKNYLNRIPFNNVYVEEKTAENILENIKKGHLYITATKEGPDIQLTYKDAIMGDTVKFAKGKSISLRLDRVASNSIIMVYSDKGLEYEETFDGGQDSTFKKELPMEGRSFYRVEVWTSSGSMVAISNPIFISK